MLPRLKSIKESKREKQEKRADLSVNIEKHHTRTAPKIKGSLSKLSFHQNNEQIIPNYQRSNVLKPVIQTSKIGTSQTNKARFSFAQARLNFLQALEAAQDEKLMKLGDLERRFSYILLQSEKNNNHKVVKYSKNILQDFKKNKAATTLSHIHQAYKNLSSMQNRISSKNLRLGEPWKKAHLPNTILQKKKNQLKRQKNNKYPKEILPSLVDELLLISNARSKQEKLERLQSLQAKLLKHFSRKLKTKKPSPDINSPHNQYKRISARRVNNQKQNPRKSKVDTSMSNNSNKVGHHKIIKKLKYGQPSKRYKERQGIKMRNKSHLSALGKSLYDKVSPINKQTGGKPAQEQIDTYEEFVNATHLGLSYEHPSGAKNKTFTSLCQMTTNIDENKLGLENTGVRQTQNGTASTLNQHEETTYENISQYKPGNSNPAQITFDQVNKSHNNNDNAIYVQKQYANNVDELSPHEVKKSSKSHDTTIFGKMLSNNRAVPDNDKSSLPLDRPETTSTNVSVDSKTPMLSAVSEQNKNMSELTPSKALENHLSSSPREKSRKFLGKVLQRAQDMFLKKVKEILAGNKTTGKEKIDKGLADDKSEEKPSQKTKGSLIYTSAYVMDESPSNTRTQAKVGPDPSGIVPKTPTNDDIVKTLNTNMAPPPLWKGGTSSQVLQTPTDPRPPLIAQSENQPQQEHPVSTQPLTLAQLQDAHEEERVALQQENVFRGLENGLNAPLNAGVYSQLKTATAPYNR